MEVLFLKVLNLSITASWLVLAVLLLRLFLKKAPKWLTCVMWGLVALRMLCPISIESIFSLIPSSEPLPSDIIYTAVPQIRSGVGVIDRVINPILTSSLTPASPVHSVNPTQVWSFVLAWMWVIGMMFMLFYALGSYLLLRWRLATATLLEKGIKQSEQISSPFVLGIVCPVIYLPYNIEEEDRSHVIAHERAHLKRRDHWWKPIGFLLLSIHWFNPLMWAAYIFLCRDIEAACDEKVISPMAKVERQAYSTALLHCSVHRRSIAVCPLAFGEVGVKERVKSVMSYKKPAFWIIVLATALVLVTAICFLTNPPNEEKELKEMPAEKDNAFAEAVQVEKVAAATETTNAGDDAIYSLEEAITAAVLERDRPKVEDGRIRVESHEVLHTDISKEGREVTVYAMVLSLEYKPMTTLGRGLEEIGGSYITTALTFDIDEAGAYTLTEYWTPRDGSYYTKDIKEKFPLIAQLKVWNSQDYADDLSAECQRKAMTISEERDPFSLTIEKLLERICTSEKGTASSTEDYIKEHPEEYAMLVNFDELTLEYCYGQFLEGGQSDLRGDIMARLCRKIAGGWGEALLMPDSNPPLNGQQWFDAFQSNAQILMKQYTNEELQKHYPVTWCLIEYLEEHND